MPVFIESREIWEARGDECDGNGDELDDNTKLTLSSSKVRTVCSKWIQEWT